MKAHQDTNDPDHVALQRLAEEAVTSEIRILVDKALERAGITVTNDQVRTPSASGRGDEDGPPPPPPLVVVNNDVAIRVRKRILPHIVTIFSPINALYCDDW